MSDLYTMNDVVNGLKQVIEQREACIEKLKALINELEVHGNFTEIYLVPKNRKCSEWITEAKELIK